MQAGFLFKAVRESGKDIRSQKNYLRILTKNTIDFFRLLLYSSSRSFEITQGNKLMKRILLLLSMSVIFLGNTTVSSKEFSLSSKNFKDGGKIPTEFTKAAGGENRSPQLSWENPPPGTKSYVITCIDINPVARRWVHWMIIHIPAEINSIPADASGGSMPKGVKELKNSFKSRGWGGPLPPPGTGVHRYVFTIYALNKTSVSLQRKRLSEKMLLRLIKDKVLGKASITGTYQQK